MLPISGPADPSRPSLAALISFENPIPLAKAFDKMVIALEDSTKEELVFKSWDDTVIGSCGQFVSVMDRFNFLRMLPSNLPSCEDLHQARVII